MLYGPYFVQRLFFFFSKRMQHLCSKNTFFHLNDTVIYLSFVIHNTYNRKTIKSKITKIPNSDENSKRKARNQLTKSKAQTDQTNG